MASCYFAATARTAAAYTIRSFNMELVAGDDARLTVTETITVDFSGERHHGIFRDIPVMYNRNGLHYRVRLHVLGVTDDRSGSRPYVTSVDHGQIRVRIGNPREFVTGVQTYVIRYEVTRAVNYFGDHDEIYWNVTGNFWDQPIERVHAVLDTGFAVADGNAKAGCATGAYGSEERACTSELLYGKDGLRYMSDSTRVLRPGEGLTIAVSVPSGLMTRPSAFATFATTLFDNWPFLLPLVALFAMFWIWLDYGRDLPMPPIAVQYEPPKLPDGKALRPGAIGVLIDERADMTDITGTIVDLAVRGYLKIKEIETTTLLFFHNRDYEFTLLKKFEADPDLNNYERRLLEGIFDGFDQVNTTVTLSSLKNQFYVHLPTITDDLYDQVTEDGLFVGSPNAVRTTWIGIGVVVIVLLAGGSFLFFRNPVAIVPSGISGLIIIGFAWLMPRKPLRGVQELAEALGFKEFLSRVERDHLERMFKQDPLLFDKCLPYAMVMGVADEWATLFEGLDRPPPSWYYSPTYGSGFYPRMFVSDLGRGLNTMGATFASRPASAGSGGSAFGGGGGGFSGGGFGGGGGGAW